TRSGGVFVRCGAGAAGAAPVRGLPDVSALDVARDGAVATVTLDRAERRNALDPSLLAELTRAFRDLSGRDDVRVVVLRGAGPAFCAGADLDWMAASRDLSWEENIADAE